MPTSPTRADTVASYAQLCARTDGAPVGSSWGLFDDPDRGTANFAGPRQVLHGAASIRHGTVFALDYPLNAFDPPMARSRTAPQHSLLTSHPESRDDRLDGFYLQASSHLDGLRHRRVSGHGFYNGIPDHQIAAGTAALGVQAWAAVPIVGRAILLDLEGLFAGNGEPLNHIDGPAIDVDTLDAALTRQHCMVVPGDIVLVHTGWARWYLNTTDDQRGTVRDNRRATGFRQSRQLPQWLWDNNIALFATDTFAVEVLPVASDSPFHDSAPEDDGMMHQELIGKLGVPLGELWNLTDLALDSRATDTWDAFVTVKPLNLVGGVGSPCNATAIR
jgi:kynurenine formamidase